MFTPEDITQIKKHGLTPEAATAQMNDFRRGFPFLDIDRAAVVGDGIVRLDDALLDDLAEQYDKILYKGEGVTVQKFVPASGAATRMFKDLFEFLDGTTSAGVERVLENGKRFAFYSDLQSAGVDCVDPKAFVSGILYQPLEYGKLPKALLKFHSYPEGARTALEEHLVEGALYGQSCNQPVKIHFTVSPEHLPLFQKRVQETVRGYEERYGVNYEITYSTQKPSTDTLAATPDNEPFRDDAGRLVFRPSGHGALLANLADLEADLIFVKTVDNVQPDSRRGDTVRCKKALAAMAYNIQQQVFDYIYKIEAGDADPEQVLAFIEGQLGYRFGESTSYEAMLRVLRRPLRVCGMVRNEGEPGGGPFWVRDADGTQSLQIAESSQISPEQKHLMTSATHFNPVDLVCMTRDVNHQKFELTAFRDERTGFISEKSSQGRALRAQELPGLWNGAMANWNTVFVEVPITTFSPVKTLADLLRPEHCVVD